MTVTIFTQNVCINFSSFISKIKELVSKSSLLRLCSEAPQDFKDFGAKKTNHVFIFSRCSARRRCVQ